MLNTNKPMKIKVEIEIEREQGFSGERLGEHTIQRRLKNIVELIDNDRYPWRKYKVTSIKASYEQVTIETKEVTLENSN